MHWLSEMANDHRFLSSMFVGLILYLVLFSSALTTGPLSVSFEDYCGAFLHYTSSEPAQFAIIELRLPRALLASLVGSSLAVSGAVMQGITRNPLAGPSIMGLLPGASLCVLIALLCIGHLGSNSSIFLALAGAICGYSIVCAVAFATPGGFNPNKLALAGTIISAVITAITQALTILFSLQDEMLYWTLGGLAHVSWSQVAHITPFFLCGTVLALLLSNSLTSLSLGHEVAISIGQRVGLVRFVASAAVLSLTASVVATAGPVAFVGLMVPHIARGLVGVQYSRIIPACIVFGACLTLVADLAARSLCGAEEVPLGLFIALVGAPFMIYLVLSRPQLLEGR